jgi:HSP20 family protein
MDRRNKTAMQLGQQSRELSPFTTVRRMMEDMDRIFGGYGWGDLGLSTLGEESQFGQLANWNPQVEVFQRDENLVVRADLPGLESKDVNVEVDDTALTIKGERKTEHEEKREKEGYFHSERSYGSFERRIPLPSGVDRSSIDASFQNGVLEVTLKLPKTSPQRVQIRGSSNVPTSTSAPTQNTTPSTLQENRTPNVSSQSNPQTPQQTNPQPDSRRNGPAPKSHN